MFTGKSLYNQATCNRKKTFFVLFNERKNFFPIFSMQNYKNKKVPSCPALTNKCILFGSINEYSLDEFEFSVELTAGFLLIIN